MRLPPYGKILLADPRPDKNIYVYCGRDGLSRAATDHRRRPILAVREDDDPSVYNWQLVQRRDVVVIEYGSVDGVRLERIAYLLLVAGAVLVVTLPEVTREMRCYRREVPNNVA